MKLVLFGKLGSNSLTPGTLIDQISMNVIVTAAYITATLQPLAEIKMAHFHVIAVLDFQVMALIV